METRLSSSQRRILFTCVAAYCAAYFNRLNLSAVLGGLMKTLSLTAAQAGLLQTAFAVTYAAGQMLNGMAADKIKPRMHMLVGLLGSSCVNLLMGVSLSYGMLVGLSMVNGLFQSMLWTPIVRLVALHFFGDKARAKANMLLSLAMVLGHLGAWGLSLLMAQMLSVRAVFIAPALLALPIALLTNRGLKGVQSGSVASIVKGRDGRMPIRPMLLRTGLAFVLGASVLYGFARDGIITWTPELLKGGGMGAEKWLTLLIPLINALGILLGYGLKQRSGISARYGTALMLLAGGGMCLMLPMAGSALLLAMVLGLSCALFYGLNPLLTGLVPLEYDGAGRVGLCAGLVDSFIYVGSALAGVVGGGLYTVGVQWLYGAWAAAVIVGAALMGISGTRKAMRGL